MKDKLIPKMKFLVRDLIWLMVVVACIGVILSRNQRESFADYSVAIFGKHDQITVLRPIARPNSSTLVRVPPKYQCVVSMGSVNDIEEFDESSSFKLESGIWTLLVEYDETSTEERTVVCSCVESNAKLKMSSSGPFIGTGASGQSGVSELTEYQEYLGVAGRICIGSFDVENDLDDKRSIQILLTEKRVNVTKP